MPQQTLGDETVIAEASDGTKLLVYADLYEEADPEDYAGDTLEVRWTEVDHRPGGVRWQHDDPDLGETSSDMEFDKFQDARLAFGLWLRCGPFHEPEGGAVPKEVATDGQDAVTAYIYLNKGHPLARSGVASICDVTEQTVSDRLSRVRWTPSENTERTDE